MQCCMSVCFPRWLAALPEHHPDTGKMYGCVVMKVWRDLKSWRKCLHHTGGEVIMPLCTVLWEKKWNVWQQCKAYKLKERLKHHLIRSVDWLGARCRAVNNIWWLWSEKIKILSKYLKGGCPKGEQNQSKRWQWWNSKSEMNGREKKRKLMNKSHERPQNLKLTERGDMIKDWIPQLSRNDARFSQSQGFTKKPTLTQG